MIVHMDNKVAAAYINHQGGVHSVQLLNVARELLSLDCTLLRSIKGVYIPGVLNRGEDIKSRRDPQDKDWSLHPELILQIWSQFRKAEVDLLAT